MAVSPLLLLLLLLWRVVLLRLVPDSGGCERATAARWTSSAAAHCAAKTAEYLCVAISWLQDASTRCGTCRVSHNAHSLFGENKGARRPSPAGNR